jgi:DNA transposition AAA+ family ATPase
MHGSLEQVHIKARRERHAILQIAQKGGQVSVDHRGVGGSRGTEKVSDYATSTQATMPSYAESASRRSVAIHLLHDSRGKHHVSSRAGRGRTCIPDAASVKGK